MSPDNETPTIEETATTEAVVSETLTDDDLAQILKESEAEAAGKPIDEPSGESRDDTKPTTPPADEAAAASTEGDDEISKLLEGLDIDAALKDAPPANPEALEHAQKLDAEVDQLMEMIPADVLEKAPDLKKRVSEFRQGVDKMVGNLKDEIGNAKSFKELQAGFATRETAPANLHTTVTAISRNLGYETPQEFLEAAGLSPANLALKEVDTSNLDLTEPDDRAEFGKRIYAEAYKKAHAEISAELRPKIEGLAKLAQEKDTLIRRHQIRDRIEASIPTIQRYFKAEHDGFVPSSKQIRETVESAGLQKFLTNPVKEVKGFLADELIAHATKRASEKSGRKSGEELDRSNRTMVGTPVSDDPYEQIAREVAAGVKGDL